MTTPSEGATERNECGHDATPGLLMVEEGAAAAYSGGGGGAGPHLRAAPAPLRRTGPLLTGAAEAAGAPLV